MGATAVLRSSARCSGDQPALAEDGCALEDVAQLANVATAHHRQDRAVQATNLSMITVADLAEPILWLSAYTVGIIGLAVFRFKKTAA
jgi:hypothetical protein